MVKLTKRIIDQTPFPASGQVLVRDSELRGFALRVTRGSKSFVLEKRIHGRMRRFTLGPYGPLTVEQARILASTRIGEIARGEDPAEIRQTRIHEPIFGDLTEWYEQRHLPRKRSAPDDRSMLAMHLKEFRARKLSDITRNDVVVLHGTIGKTAPYRANRVVALLRKMFNLAKDWGLMSGDNPATRIQFFKEVSRDRFLHPDELPRFFAAIAEESDIRVRAAFLTALLTGARRQEVLTMRWDDLSLERAEWRIPLTKAGRPHVLPLVSPLLSLLKQLPRQSGNSYVFSGQNGVGHRVNMKRAWQRIQIKAQISDVRIHDLRRTVGSWLASSGESLSLIGKVLNHCSVNTTAIYARLNLDPVRQALERNAAKMLSTTDPYVHHTISMPESKKLPSQIAGSHDECRTRSASTA
jgi:integrase